MDDVRTLKALQLDALREVANIGAGHAATALSQMTQRTIMIAVPEVNVRPLEDVAELFGRADQVICAVLMHMMGDLTGRAMILFPEESARNLVDILLRRQPGTTQAFDAMEQSGLKEVGNILVSAYLTALSDFLTTTYLNFGHDRDYVFCVETAFEVAGTQEQLRGHFLLLPDLPSLRAIFDAIRVS
jgi:chemotaxis protein CheC